VSSLFQDLALLEYEDLVRHSDGHRAEPTETSGDGDVADGTMDVQ
jgi:hypothetical protein